MAVGDLSFARFPITLDLDAPADTVPQTGTPVGLFLPSLFDIVMPEILPMTGTGGKSKGVVIVFGRDLL